MEVGRVRGGERKGVEYTCSVLDKYYVVTWCYCLTCVTPSLVDMLQCCTDKVHAADIHAICMV